jgi:competence protein ComEA
MLQKTKISCVLILCIGLALSSVSVLAQKSNPVKTEKINLNTASAEMLETLPGIGPETAKRIVDHRTKIGKYKTVEEILNIKGIGEKKFQRIKNLLVVSSQ